MPTMHLAGRDIPVEVTLETKADNTGVNSVTIKGSELPHYIERDLCRQEIARERLVPIDEARRVMAIIDGGEHTARRVNHTPGPWQISRDFADKIEVRGPQDGGVIVARIPEWGMESDCLDATLANASLIAAAPDLLDALHAIVMECTPFSPQRPHSAGSYIPRHMLEAAREAIAKAGGRP